MRTVYEPAFKKATLYVRIDGAGWIVPTGTTRVVDDFDGEVGIFAIP